MCAIFYNGQWPIEATTHSNSNSNSNLSSLNPRKSTWEAGIDAKSIDVQMNVFKSIAGGSHWLSPVYVLK